MDRRHSGTHINRTDTSALTLPLFQHIQYNTIQVKLTKPTDFVCRISLSRDGCWGFEGLLRIKKKIKKNHECLMKCKCYLQEAFVFDGMQITFIQNGETNETRRKIICCLGGKK